MTEQRMSKYYYALSHFDYGVMITPAGYLKKPIWIIRFEEALKVVSAEKYILIKDKDIQKKVDYLMTKAYKTEEEAIEHLPRGKTLEELINKIKDKKE